MNKKTSKLTESRGSKYEVYGLLKHDTVLFGTCVPKPDAALRTDATAFTETISIY